MSQKISKFALRLRAFFRYPTSVSRRKKYYYSKLPLLNSQHMITEGQAAVIDCVLPRSPLPLPLNVMQVPRGAPRVSLVTDSLASNSLFGGVGTAIFLCSMLADRLGASLRIITKVKSDASVVARVLKTNGIDFKHKIEVVHASLGGRSISVSPDDIFVPMSWWTVRSVLNRIPRDRIAYLLQEDERMFYPRGDERSWCSETLSERGFPVVINSQLLFEHLVDQDPIPGLKANATWFEPAISLRRPTTLIKKAGKKSLFFYARPDNPRNLFWHGVNCIADGIEREIISTEEWELHFVGRNIPRGLLGRHVSVKYWEGLDWKDYQNLISEMDLGISLMDTPHPSYPPLDLAAGGAAVLTSASLGKVSLDRYSKNIILARPDPASLREGLREAVKLANDCERRLSNCLSDNIQRDWVSALSNTVVTLAEHFSRAGGRSGHLDIPRSRSAEPLVR